MVFAGQHLGEKSEEGGREMLRYRSAPTVAMAMGTSLLPSGVLAGDTSMTQVVALTGQPAYGIPSENFHRPLSATINNSGVVAFEAETGVPGNVLDNLFLWQSGQGSLLARQGEPMAGHATRHYRNFQTPQINDEGRVVFLCNPSDATSEIGLVTGFSGALSLVAVSWSEPPGTSYLTGINSLGGPLLARSGPVSFRGGLVTHSFYSGFPGDITVRLTDDQQVPGLPPDAGSVGYAPIRMNPSADLIAWGPIRHGEYEGERVVVATGPNGPRAIVAPGIPAPGVGEPFISAGLPPSFNSAGQIAVEAVAGPSISGPFTTGIWRGSYDGELSLLARVGDAAPGPGPGFVFEDVGTPMLNRSGDVAMLGRAVNDANDVRNGIWLVRPEGTSLVGLLNDPVTNLPPGTVLSGFNGLTIPAFAFNDRDLVAFVGRVQLPGGSRAASLVYSDGAGGWGSLATVGFPFELAPGDTRIVSNVAAFDNGFSEIHAENGDDGYGTFFNDANQLVYLLAFTDGSNAIVETQIPSPSSALAVLALGCASACRRRRSRS